MAYSNLDGFSVEGPAPARIAPKHVMKGGVYTISLGLFTARDTRDREYVSPAGPAAASGGGGLDGISF